MASGARVPDVDPHREPRLFTAWLQRADVTGALHVDWPYDFPQRPPLQDEQRFAVLRRLLHDHDIGLRERFAGSVLLLYAQPLTRIAQLRTSDIMTADSGEIAITVARGAIVLPEPLASIALALRYQRISNGDVDGWLLPGRKPGTHITAEHLPAQAPGTLRRHQPSWPPRRAARPSRPAPGTDPCRAPRHPPGPRRTMGPRRRRHLQRLRRAPYR
ncbi:MAG: hypothetical protein M3Q31_21050, partial [Actinomycetota bacterium]|nr:hypothetical protein [Actinomycetota bacterium]